MSWIRDTKDKRSWLQQFCANVLKSGSVPKHVAFIMDGNRRYAKKNSMDRAEGHLMGFDKLAQTLEWCLDLGITEVTVYAFSIENFKRSKDEVDCLMELARKKFAKLLEEKEMIAKHEVCIRVLGDLELLPDDVQQLIAEAVSFSRNNKKATLNVCFAYTSRHEMCCAMREVAEGVQLGLIRESDISESVLDRCMFTSPSKDPDLLVRTSGEVRLSDFLLWQSSYSVLSFIKVLWPDFSIWHLYSGVFYFQRNIDAVMRARESALAEAERSERESDYECVVQEMAEESKVNNCKHSAHVSLQDRLNAYTQQRKERVERFISHVYSKRDTYINQLVEKHKNRTPLCS